MDKLLGGTTDQLLAVYLTRIRSILEFTCPVFHSGLTKDQSQQIELVQKKGLAVILGKAYQFFESALKQLHLQRLDSRRTNLCLMFARHCGMFTSTPIPNTSTQHLKLFMEYTCKTSRQGGIFSWLPVSRGRVSNISCQV